MRPLRGEGRTPRAIPANAAESTFLHERSASWFPGMPVELTGNGQITGACSAGLASGVGGRERSGAVAQRRLVAVTE